MSEFPPIDDSTPIPPRYWWLKRILIGSGVLLLALVALRLWWGWYASRQLQAEIDRIIAAGQPIYPEDFDLKEEIPDDQNAAYFLQEAAKSINLVDQHSVTFQAIYQHDQPVEAHMAAIAKMLEANKRTLELTRRARNFDDVDWGIRIRTPAIETSTYSYGDQRQLSKILSVAAEYYFLTGRFEEATQACRDGVFLADTMGLQPTVISQLVAWAIFALAQDRIELFVLTSGDECSSKDSDVQAVRTLIRQLMDDETMLSNMERALLGERMFQLDMLKELDQGTKAISDYFGWAFGAQARIPDFVWKVALAPSVRLDTLRLLRDTQTRLDAVQDSRLFDAVLDDSIDIEASMINSILYPFSAEINSSLDRWIEISQRYLAQRRLTAVGLSLRLFRFDHGRLPEMLDELTPDYLNSLPLDPQSPTRSPIGYLPDSASPIVYGVGENGVDDGGDYEISGGWVSRASKDMPFFINGDRPRPPPKNPDQAESGETSENDEDVEDDKGHEDDREQEEPHPD